MTKQQGDKLQAEVDFYKEALRSEYKAQAMGNGANQSQANSFAAAQIMAKEVQAEFEVMP